MAAAEPGSAVSAPPRSHRAQERPRQTKRLFGHREVPQTEEHGPDLRGGHGAPTRAQEIPNVVAVVVSRSSTVRANGGVVVVGGGAAFLEPCVRFSQFLYLLLSAMGVGRMTDALEPGNLWLLFHPNFYGLLLGFSLGFSSGFVSSHFFFLCATQSNAFGSMKAGGINAFAADTEKVREQALMAKSIFRKDLHLTTPQPLFIPVFIC